VKITMRHLQVFDAVARLGSVTSAAESLRMSQGAASTALRDLQIILGRPLFAHVRGRPLQLTEEGRRLKPMVYSILHQVDDIGRVLETELSGWIVIGATTLMAETALPEICVKFRRLYPKVNIKIEIGSQSELIQRIENMELETALIEGRLHQQTIECTPWREEELWLVTAPTHPLAQRTNLRIRDLADMTWYTRELLASTTVRLRVTVQESAGIPPGSIEAGSDHSLRMAVIAGDGIGCLSRDLVEDDVEVGRLARLDVRDFQLTRGLNLVRPKGVWRRQLAQVFDKYLLEHGVPQMKL